MNPVSARSISRQIAALNSMTAEELRARWRELFSAEPVIITRAYLINRLAYRLQELMLGELSAETRNALEEVLEYAGANALGMARPPRTSGPVTGTRLLREWGGVQHEVIVTIRGYEYRGKVFRSLSSVATAITSTTWNGKEFFGLSKRGTR